jgi:hypothetical protein
MRVSWIAVLGVLSVSGAACGPGKRPPEGCDGPSFDLVVRARDVPLPPDTRINVHYGSNQEGEPYALGQPARKQAVFCDEDTTPGGGAPSDDGPSESAAGAGGAATSEPPDDADVWALRCRLYTQGAASIDVYATGYEPIEDYSLPVNDEDDRCDVFVSVKLEPLRPETDD